MLVVAGICFVIAVSVLFVLLREDRNPNIEPEAIQPPAIREKLAQYWLSTPVWVAIGMIGALVASRVSTQVVLIVAAGILSFEVWRVKFYEKTLLRLASTVIALIVFAGLAILAWPKLKPTPLDQQFVEAIRRNFPWLATPPESHALAAAGSSMPKTGIEDNTKQHLRPDSKVLEFQNSQDLIDRGLRVSLRMTALSEWWMRCFTDAIDQRDHQLTSFIPDGNGRFRPHTHEEHEQIIKQTQPEITRAENLGHHNEEILQVAAAGCQIKDSIVSHVELWEKNNFTDMDHFCSAEGQATFKAEDLREAGQALHALTKRFSGRPKLPDL